MAGSLVGTLALAVKADLERFRRDLRAEATKAGDEAGATLGARIKSRLTGANIGTAIGATIGGLGVGALRIADQYDTAMDTIRTGTGATGEALRGLEADFAAVAARVPAELGLVGQVVADLNTRTGQTGKGLQDLGTQVLEVSRITKTDAARNVALLTRLYGDWSVATEDQAAANDKLFRTSQATGVGFDTLAEQVVAFGAPLRALGIDLDTGLALLGKWEKEGVNVETVLTGMRMAVANFAKAGVDPSVGLPALIEKIGTLDDAQGLLAAKQVVGQRAANDFFRAVKEGRFDVEELLTVVEDGADTIETATRDTDGFGEAWRRLKNQVAVAVGPIVDDLAGIGSELGNLVFLLPALTGALGRGLGAAWTKLGGGAAVRAAVAAAGTVAGLIYQGAAFAGTKLLAAAQAAWAMLGGPQALGAVRSLGSLAGGTFGTAFRIAGAAAVALLWVEVWNQWNAFQAKVSEAQAQLQGKADAAIDKTGAEAIEGLETLTKALREIQGFERVIGDTFGGAQEVEALRNLGTAVLADATLTAGQIEQAIDLVGAAAVEAAARGNGTIEAELLEMQRQLTERLRGGAAATVEAVGEAYDPLSSIRVPTVPPPRVDEPIRDEFVAARKAIAAGFGSIKAALADPPKLISRTDRLENMESRFRRVMRNLRKAVEANDPGGVEYWTRAAITQQLQMDRMRTRTTRSVGGIRKAFRDAGVDIDGTWLEVGRGADRATGKVEGVEGAIDDLPARHDTEIAVDTGGALRRIMGLRDAFRSLPTTVRTSVVTSIRESQHIGGLQHGGRVQAGLPYVVGEVRPELFIPDVSGRIEPRVSPGAIRAGGREGSPPVTTVNLQLHGLPMLARTPRDVVAEMRRATRYGVPQPYRRAPAWEPS